MRSLLFISCLLLLLTGLLWGCAEPEEREDPEAGKVLDSPLSVAFDGTYLYVANANFNLSDDGRGFIAVIDPERLLDGKGAVVSKLEIPPLCGHIELDVESKTLYLADRRNDKVIPVSIEDPLNMELGDGIEVAGEPYRLLFDADTNRLFVATLSGYLSVLDMDRCVLIRNFLLASKLSSLAMGPDHGYLAAGSRVLGVVYLFDPVELDFLFSFQVAGSGWLESTRALAVSPDGERLYVATKSPSVLAVYRNDRLPWYPDRALVALVPLDCQPEDILAFDDGVAVA
ncbi:MAG TPA: hypothetical protein ENF73_02525, partial [Proteobacteria bacterium]|nr:hypothetical protein [Pseudomonadota bacterium]